VQLKEAEKCLISVASRQSIRLIDQFWWAALLVFHLALSLTLRRIDIRPIWSDHAIDRDGEKDEHDGH
jgi:hypothetical protein